MASYYVRSGAAGAGTGADWANAYTTLVAAFSGKSAGDVFLVADDHAETQATAMTLTSPGTVANPCRVLCVNTHTAEPPTGSATTASITTTLGSSVTLIGYAYVYGVSINIGTGGNSASLLLSGAGASGWVFDTSRILLIGSGSSGSITVGNSGSSVRDIYLELRATPIWFGQIGQGIRLLNGHFIWRDTAGAILGAAPTNLITTQNIAGIAEITGVDLSAIGSGKSLVAASAISPHRISFANCRFGPSVSIISGAISGPGGVRVWVDNCDSGDTNYRMEHYEFQGSIRTETTRVRTAGGASDGTTPISHAFSTLASGPSLFCPLAGPWMSIWNEDVGTAKTVTVELCTEDVGLYNDECWLEVEYPGTSGYPQSAIASSRVADVFAGRAALTGSAVSWNGFSTAAPQKLAVAFTPQERGPIRARVCVAQPAAAVYVDPLLAVS